MLKSFFYDFGGLNIYLFKLINSYFGKEKYDYLMILADFFAGYRNFKYHLLVLIIFAAFTILTNRNNQARVKFLTFNWLEFMATLLSSVFACFILIFALKAIFLLPRPFCSQDLVNIHEIKIITGHASCFHSFPSGHTSFCTVFVASLWPYANRIFRFFGAILIVLIGISRITAGAHFPADVIWSFVLSLAVTILARHCVKSIISRHGNLIYNFIPWISKA